MFSEMVTPSHHPLPRLPPAYLIQNRTCGASTSHWQGEGTSFSSTVGLGSAGVGERWTPEQNKER